MSDTTDLRRQAKQRITSRPIKSLHFLTQNTSELIEELQIHQEELLIQNEALEQAQAQLEASHQEYINLFEFAPVGYFILDQTGRILSANLTGAGQLNVPRQKLLNRNFAEYIAPASQDAFYLHCQQLYQFGVRQSCALQLLTANRALFEAQLEIILTQPKDGEPQLRITVTDVTEYKQLERTYQTLVEQSLQGLAIFQDGHIVFANSALARLCGYPVEELLTFSPDRLNEMVHPQDQTAFQQHLALCLGVKGADPQLEFRLVCPDGETRWINLYANLIEYHGQPALKLVYLDISRRKQVEAENEELLEALTEQNTRLRELGARLTEVQETERQHLARELHDQVGQSLTALGFRLNFLKTEVGERGAPDHLAEALTLLDQATDSIRRVTAELRPPMLDERGFVEALRWHAGKVTGWAGVAINLEADELDPRPPLLVEHHLFRIAQEAVNNAVKHSGASEIAISIQAKKYLIRIMVTDNGCGFKAPASTQLVQQSGSGLLNLHERAEMIDGLCRIESKPGHGTRVIVEVPRH
jgi:PAS domain S-box-containing protein